jgi:citrate lyase subunit beta / citryl-CoA lyase
MPSSDRPRRSVLYLPASNPRAIAKARSIAADVIVLDLEDAVAPESKAEARAAAVAAIGEGGFGERELVIRANGLDTEWGAEDLAAIAGSGAHAVLVPKVSSAEDVRRYEEALAGAPAAMELWAMVETCGAVLRLDEIASLGSASRLSLFVVGTNDLSKEMRARLTPGRAPFLGFLAQTVAAARAHGLSAIDGVCNEFRDLALFRAEAEQGRAFGFDGKSLIHPDQVEPCNAVFSPDPAEIAWARAVLDAFALPENAGKGAIRVEGKMAELLHCDEARRTLAIAERIAAGSSQGAP